MFFKLVRFCMEEAGGDDGGNQGGGGSFMGGGNNGGGGDNPPANDGGGSGNPPADGGASGGGGVQYQYPKGLDESYHDNPTLLRYAQEDGSFDQAKIFKDLIHSKASVGADKMVVPHKNFTDEQWRETFQKLGLPEKVEDYNIDVKAPEGFDVNEELIGGLKEKAHELGVLPNQLQGIVEYYNQFTTQDVQKSNQQFQQQLEEGVKTLKNEWGDAYENNLKLADQALKHFFPDKSELDDFLKTGITDTPQGTKFFAQLGKALSEDTFDHETKGSFGAGPEELDGLIKETHGELSKMGRFHPQYQSKLKEYQNLLNKKHGTDPVSAGAPIR